MAKLIGIVATCLVLLIAGGTITAWGIKVDLPGVSRFNLKEYLIKPEDVVEKFWQYNSDHPVLIYEVTTKNDTLKENIIIKCSPTINAICGLCQSSKRLNKKSAEELYKLFKDMMHPKNYEKFKTDHDRMLREIALSKKAIARVPITFNHKHTNTTLRNKSYLPVVVHMASIKTKKEDVNEEKKLVTILLLDIENVEFAKPQPIKSYGYDWENKTFFVKINPGLLAFFEGQALYLIAFIKRDGIQSKLDKNIDISSPKLINDLDKQTLELSVECKNISKDLDIGKKVYGVLATLSPDIYVGGIQTIQDITTRGGHIIQAVGNTAMPYAGTPEGLYEFYNKLNTKQRTVFLGKINIE